ncbi:hypothetical protein GCM10010377_75820 [Streptomyces viridiviolaceus]|nr:hypothetical protein GCM10010377_75820 [Streptomyces viridiviolaceus]
MSIARNPMRSVGSKTSCTAPRSVPGPYEMPSLRTDAERAEAAAPVEERLCWLTRCSLSVPARIDVPAVFRDAECTSAGLYDENAAWPGRLRRIVRAGLTYWADQTWSIPRHCC